LRIRTWLPRIPLEAVGQLGAGRLLIGKLAHKERKRLSVTGDAQRPGIHRLKTYIADQSCGDVFAVRVIAAARTLAIAVTGSMPNSTNGLLCTNEITPGAINGLV
jgi:hypothetical protein